MQNSNDEQITQYKELLRKLVNCFTSLSHEYVEISRHHTSDKRPLLNSTIINLLQQNTDLLNYSSSSHRDRLKAILMHYSSEQLPQKRETGDQLNSLLASLSAQPDDEDQLLTDDQLEVLTEIADNLVQQCSELIMTKRRQQEIINNIQASAIILNLYNLSREEKKLSLEQLLFLKDLWQIDFTSNVKTESILILFHQSISVILNKKNPLNHQEVIGAIVNFLIDKNNVLEELPNVRLIYLYNRLQALCTKFDTAKHIVMKIYKESRYRNHDKFNNSSYHLLKLFENYNTILAQIENTEFSIAERFLLQKNAFLHEVLINITKYTDLIRALGITENADLRYILTETRKELTQDIQSGHTISLMISSLESKFSVDSRSKANRRFALLDDFTRNVLVDRFNELFAKILLLLTQDMQYVEFIQNAIVYKIAADYVLHKGLESVGKSRLLELDRLYIIEQLQGINFVEIFSGKYSNRTSSLHFKKYIRKERIETSREYVVLIIRVLLTNLKADQLQVLLQHLIDDNCAIKKIVEQELSSQIKKRTTINKILYYVFTRQKKELTILNDIKKSMQQLHDVNNRD